MDARVLSATNKDLKKEAETGAFRQDLFYRINGLNLKLPALRERSDFVELTLSLAHRIATQSVRMSDEFLMLLQRHDWPGNIRELENLLERLSILAEGEVLQEHELPEHMRQSASSSCMIIETAEEIPADGIDFNAMVDEFETRLISMALSRTNGNKKAAASLLRLNRTTLVEKIKKKGLERNIEISVSDERGLFDDIGQELVA